VSTVYAFRQNRSLKNCDPQAVGDELERLRESHGTLTPDSVLEAARDEDSPLHHAFEWDDTEAARQHRLAQARRLIVSIRVVNSPAQARVPAYISVRTPDRGRSYLPSGQVLSSEDLKSRVVLEVRQFIESLERRYAAFEEVYEVLTRMKKSVG
jgi:hypothetical protein